MGKIKIARNLLETDLDKLRVVSKEVDMSDVSLTSSIETSMLSTYQSMGGKMQGMAAIQIGYPYRAILLRYEKDTKEPIVAYNPSVLIKFGSRRSNEGCLSEGDARFLVRRPILVRVRYMTRMKDVVTEWLTYRKARIFMHELDHLNGILLTDKGKRVQ